MLTSAVHPGNPLPGIGSSERLAVLHQYGILDTPPEPAFDDITRLISHICQTPIAAIAFVDKDRQWFKSENGIGVRETPVKSPAGDALLQSQLLVVPDLLADDRFKHYPLVSGPPHARFYAGAVLLSSDHFPLGALCVLDCVPRQLSDLQVDALLALARQVMTNLELRHALQAAQKANQAKDHFLATLSHELRTPLSPALMIATLLASDQTLPSAAREDAELIRRNIEMETHLIDDLLDVTRVTAGKIRLQLAPSDVHTIIKDSVRMCASDAAAKEIAIDLKLKAAHHYARADAPKLQQVFCNLLKNAVKFTPRGGKATISSANESPERLIITVTDTGTGIAPEILPRLFQPFEQGGNEITQQYGGLGLGLTISKGIVEAHGGTIAAYSEGKDRGARLVIQMQSMPVIASVAPAARRGGGKRRHAALSILLVDDHQDTLRAMSRLLSNLKHKVITADSMQRALQAANENQFDLLISDVGLPDGNGLDLMRRLLAQRPIRGIALTGYGAECDMEMSRKAGFHAHLTKPIDFQQLEEAIHDLSSQ